MEILQDLLREIYNIVVLPILQFIAKTPVYFAKLILFLVIVAFGYIIGRIVDFIIKLALSYMKIDEFLKNNRLENAFFGIKPSIFIRSLVRYYIYLYFIVLGLESFGISSYLLLNYLNTFYAIFVIVSVGSIIAEIIGLLLRGVTDKQTIIDISKGIVIYIFFIWALEIVGLPTSIFQTILELFMIAIAISIGVSFGILLVLENKETIKKIFQK